VVESDRKLAIARLDSLDDAARTQASSAHLNVPAHAADDGVDTLQVRTLRALGLNVRVANVIGHLSLLPANITLRWHGFSEGA
jgi:hypothetical protein